MYLKNFRCFSEKFIELDSPLILLEGLNGSGKTSLVEAMHYLCYLRSFRTHSPKELLYFGQDNFFLKAAVTASADATQNELQVGFSGKKRLVKINQRAVSSYKDLMDHYRVVTLTEDDGGLIKDGPETRRLFIDQALVLANPSITQQLRLLRHLVDNRNALLHNGSYNAHEFEVWTHQLWSQSQLIRQARIALLKELEQEVATILTEVDPTLQVSFSYAAKHVDQEHTFAQFMEASRHLFSEEGRYRRSLFGAHLDDFVIRLQDRFTRQFASRGQQKLVVLLTKIAQVKQLMIHRGPVIFLLDDFMTDFDARRATQLLPPLVALGGQLIFTSPSVHGSLHTHLTSIGAKTIILTS